MGIEAERFVHAIPRDALCILCNNVLDDPVEIIECGHFVCFACWEEWKRDGKESVRSNDESTCPYCGNMIKLDSIRKSKITWNLIKNLNVYCRNRNKGCESIIKYGHDELHRQKCLFDEKCKQSSKNIEKCSICNLSIVDHTHDCIKELLKSLKQYTIQTTSLEHENNHLASRLTTREKEFLENMTQIEGEFYLEALKFDKEIRDLRTRLASVNGELGRRKGKVRIYFFASILFCFFPQFYPM